MTFFRDDDSEVEVDIKWAPAEPDVGIMSNYIDDYTLPDGEPPLTDAEEKRLMETAEEPEPDEPACDDRVW